MHRVSALASMLLFILGICSTMSYSHTAGSPQVRHEGAVGVVISGESKPKTGEEILAIARKAKFYEEGRMVSKVDDNRTIVYTPAEFDDADTVPKALIHGLLIHKLTINGPPSEFGRLHQLGPGTYYVFLEYIDGQWQTVTVDERGTARCVGLATVRWEIGLGKEAPPNRLRHQITSHKTGRAGAAVGVVEKDCHAGPWVSRPPGGCQQVIICPEPPI